MRCKRVWTAQFEPNVFSGHRNRRRSHRLGRGRRFDSAHNDDGGSFYYGSDDGVMGRIFSCSIGFSCPLDGRVLGVRPHDDESIICRTIDADVRSHNGSLGYCDVTKSRSYDARLNTFWVRYARVRYLDALQRVWHE